jgi:peptidyl-prolyl cis-trans isomerase-like protein 2
MEKFYHIQFDTRTKEQIAEEKREMESPSYFLNKVTGEARATIDKLNAKYVEKKNEVEKDQIADKINAAHYSKGKVSAGFTSTTLDPVTRNESAVLEEQEVNLYYLNIKIV